jgi:hypothetical protein
VGIVSDLFKKPSARGYIAPTFYLRAGKYVSGYNYYGSMQQAVSKYAYLQGWSGGQNVAPAGSVIFSQNGAAQTIGINCDLYIYKDGSWQLSSYGYLRGLSTWPPIIVKAYLTNGTGPFYFIYSHELFGLSATVTKDLPPEKVAALDEFWRELQLLQHRYNSFVGFLNYLGKRELNNVEKQILNDGLLLLDGLNNEISRVPGIELFFTDRQTVGAIPVLLVLAGVALLGGTAAWTVASIQQEREKTKRINDAYDLHRWVAERQIEVSRLAAEGKISNAAADNINKTLANAASSATKVADQAAKNSGGLFGDLASIVKYGVLGVAGIALFSYLKKSS